MPLSDLVAPNAIIPALKVNGKKQTLQELAERAAGKLKSSIAGDARASAELARAAARVARDLAQLNRTQLNRAGS